MNGNRFVLDTNAIVSLLQGNIQLAERLKTADWIGISIISQIEFLVFDGLSDGDRQRFEKFVERIDIIDLSGQEAAFIQQIISMRQKYRLKLPDAIIAAATFNADAILVTADREFGKVTDLETLNPLTLSISEN